MKLPLLALFVLSGIAIAAPVGKLANFELTDQDAKKRTYHFPKSKITVMVVADHKGSRQLAPWIQRLYDRYETRIDIDGVADVSMIAPSFRGMFRRAFKRQFTYSVMLDWEGSVVRQFGYEKGVANIYVIDRRGCIVKRLSGSINDSAMRELAREIDRAITGTLNEREDGNR